MEESTTREPLASKTPNVSVLDTNLGLAPADLIQGVFRAHIRPETKALIITGWATGTVHEALLPLIQETTEKGVSVFILSNNPGENHGVKALKYEPHVKAVEAGAIPLRDVNINQEVEVFNAVQEEIDKGKAGKELSDAIAERFGTPTSETTK